MFENIRAFCRSRFFDNAENTKKLLCWGTKIKREQDEVGALAKSNWYYAKSHIEIQLNQVDSTSTNLTN